MDEKEKPSRRKISLLGEGGLPVSVGVKPPESARRTVSIAEGPDSVPSDVKAHKIVLDNARVLEKARKKADESLTAFEYKEKEWWDQVKREKDADIVNEEIAADEAVKQKLLKKDV